LAKIALIANKPTAAALMAAGGLRLVEDDQRLAVAQVAEDGFEDSGLLLVGRGPEGVAMTLDPCGKYFRVNGCASLFPPE
jgi:hypothetical protein